MRNRLHAKELSFSSTFPLRRTCTVVIVAPVIVVVSNGVRVVNKKKQTLTLVYGTKETHKFVYVICKTPQSSA